MKNLILPFALILAACSAASEPAPEPVATDVATADTPAAPDAPPISLRPPVSEPQPGDLAPCPGINPDIRRPAGSNCLGITPDECGADQVQLYVGVEGKPNIRDQIASHSKGRFRWIPHMTAVTDDLDPTRMNVLLDENGIIVRIDCY